MGELVYGILLGIVIIVQSFALMYQMNQFSKREDDLIAAIIAKHVGEFALAQTEMRTKMKEKIDKLNIQVRMGNFSIVKNEKGDLINYQTDLEILDYLARLFKHHVKQALFDPEEIFEEFKRYTENELDYVKEANNIKVFYNNFRNDKKIEILYTISLQSDLRIHH